MKVAVRHSLKAPLLDVMNFLNEVTLRYPHAISLAPGRPFEGFCDVRSSLAAVDRFVHWRADTSGTSVESVYRELGQYNRTNGIINELIVRQLANDEGINLDPEALMVTVGAQEAMLILLLGIFEPGTDVLLCSDPAYIGMTGPATIAGIEVVGVPSGPNGLTADAVERAIARIKHTGRTVKAIYDVPNFNNPLGTTMPESARRELLALARRAGVLVIEDNPYGLFAYDEERQPTLKSLDESATVLYVGSYAKVVHPGLRLGFLAADQRGPSGVPLAAELSRVKSLTTVNTPALPQAMLGGILLEHGCSLRAHVAPRVELYRRNRDQMLSALEREIGARGMRDQVAWNRPSGGFFVTVTLPFPFDEACLESCAAEHGVIVCPMSFFALSPGRERQIRLSYSYADAAQIDAGIQRLAQFISSRLPQDAGVGSGHGSSSG